jgi:hypothetical protein
MRGLIGEFGHLWGGRWDEGRGWNVWRVLAVRSGMCEDAMWWSAEESVRRHGFVKRKGSVVGSDKCEDVRVVEEGREFGEGVRLVRAVGRETRDSQSLAGPELGPGTCCECPPHRTPPFPREWSSCLGSPRSPSAPVDWGGGAELVHSEELSSQPAAPGVTLDFILFT